MPRYSFMFTDGRQWLPEEIDVLKTLVAEEVVPYGDKGSLAYRHFTGDPLKILAEFPNREIAISGGDLPMNAWEALNVRLDELLSYITKRTTAPAAPLRHNEMIQVPIPGLGLLAIRQTCVLEDACTDKLQDKLDEGWSILAVCPQEARRPDYILGRATP